MSNSPCKNRTNKQNNQLFHGKRRSIPQAAGKCSSDLPKADLETGHTNSSCEPSDEAPPVLCGLKPVLELLEQEPERADLVLVRKGRHSRETDALLDRCRTAGVRFRLVDAATLDRAAPAGHQGVAVRLFDAGFVSWETLSTDAANAPLPLLVALDQVQDPGNVGTLARTLYAMGGAGLLIPRHNSAYLGAGARRAAAGALERLPVARVINLARALDKAADEGWHICGASSGSGSVNALTSRLPLPTVLVLGNEEHGPRPQVLKRCERLLAVPMLRPFDSLNVAQAGAVLISCFARAQQRAELVRAF